MDELFEVADLVADSGLEGAVSWLFRAIGVVAILAGLGLWLLAELSLVPIPVSLMVIGVLLVLIPSILVEVLG